MPDPVSTAQALIPCLVCGGKDFAEHSHENGVRVVRCRTCRLVFNNPQELKRDVEEIYSESYFKSTKPALGYEDYAAARDDIQKSFRRKIRHLLHYQKGGTLLDVGCATGFFLEVAHQSGFEVAGIDISSWAADEARRRYPDYRIYTGFLDQTPELQKTLFDVVTCWDVIEQLPDPKAFFKSAAGALKPGGLLVLTVRNIDSLMSRLLGTRWIHFRTEEKFAYFNPRNVRHLLNSLGLDLVRHSAHGAGKDCTMEILLHKMEHSIPKLAGILKTAVHKLGLSEARLYLNFGDSLIVVARKREKS